MVKRQSRVWICVAALTVGGCGRVSHPQLQDQLVRMAERDQAARQQFLATESAADSVAAANVMAVDAANQDSLRRIIDAHGWPRKADRSARRGRGLPDSSARGSRALETDAASGPRLL